MSAKTHDRTESNDARRAPSFRGSPAHQRGAAAFDPPGQISSTADRDGSID